MYVTPETIRKLDELVRAALQSLRDRYFLFLEISTALVLIGVILEGPDVWSESLDFLRKMGWLRPPEKVDAKEWWPLPPERNVRNWITACSAVGLFLVIVGVAGEGVFEALVTISDGELQTFNEGSIAGLTLQISEANAHAEEARSMAEAERRRGIELLAQIQPRDLTKTARDQIRKALERNKVKVRVIAYAGDAEGSRFAQEIVEVVGTKDPGAVTEIPFLGQRIVYGTRVCRLSPSPGVARVIAAALGASMVVDLQSGYPVNCGPNELALFIGVKPLPAEKQDSSVTPPIRAPRSLDENVQLRIAGSLAPFRGVVMITYLEVVPDSPELAGQVYRVLDKAVPNKGIGNDLSYRDLFDLPPDPVGIEVRHTSDSEASAFAEALTSALEGEIHGVRAFTELKMPFTSLPPNDPASSRVVVRIGRNP